ncbi:MAG: phage holin family protein [Oscillospiraceae bacterium]
MQETFNYIKVAIAGIIAFIAAKLGMLAPLLLFLFIAMALDYISGIIAAATSGELNSKRGMFGILKKLGYCITVGVALITDKLIITVGSEFVEMPVISLFAMLTIVWLTLNELLSILENLGKIGVPLPAFLNKIIKTMKDGVEKKGDSMTKED